MRDDEEIFSMVWLACAIDSGRSLVCILCASVLDVLVSVLSSVPLLLRCDAGVLFIESV